ncbi:MAG: hypothetical protein GTN35_02285 [Nitrososphaeria archaeon]|nr:hypothetical protein [Nitrosopumilaceae archaeon]NIP09675.1 hypothetical protein [Nitrosopumilaceae archaeon]NIP91222.1 hypothetical protein [Nitrososphaeria archaeon]NIS95734.1 hypothetical protein [Nitrosopumilaceae archaeon]
MGKSKMIQCEVCDFEVLESDWETHINTSQHKENALTQIMEDRLGKERLAKSRDETTEFLEELEHDLLQKKSDSENVE